MGKLEDKNTRVGFKDAKVSNPRSLTDSNQNIQQAGQSLTGSIGNNLNDKEDGKGKGKGTFYLTAGDEDDNRDSYLPEDSKDKNQSSDTAEDHEQFLSTFLSFKTADLESEFSTYFVTLNLPRWRRTISVLFVILSGLYVYLIARNTVESVEYEAKYKPALKTALSCPVGWYW